MRSSHFYTTKVKVLVKRNVFARGFERTCYNPLVFLMFSSLKQHVKAYQDEDNQSLPNRIRGGKGAPQMLNMGKCGNPLNILNNPWNKRAPLSTTGKAMKNQETLDTIWGHESQPSSRRDTAQNNGLGGLSILTVDGAK